MLNCIDKSITRAPTGKIMGRASITVALSEGNSDLSRPDIPCFLLRISTVTNISI